MRWLLSRPTGLNSVTHDRRQKCAAPPAGQPYKEHSLFNQSLDLKVECLVHWEHDALHLYYLLIPARLFFFLKSRVKGTCGFLGGRSRVGWGGYMIKLHGAFQEGHGGAQTLSAVCFALCNQWLSADF